MKNQTEKIALCGILTALGTVILMAGTLLPGMVYAVPLVASLFLVAIIRETAISWAWGTWTVTALLALILGTDKEAAFFYLFLGWYPALRPKLQRFKPGFQFVLKTIIFLVAVGAMYGFLIFVLHLEAVTEDFGSISAGWNAVFFALMVVTMLIYDVFLGRFALIYEFRIRKKLRFH